MQISCTVLHWRRKHETFLFRGHTSLLLAHVKYELLPVLLVASMFIEIRTKVYEVNIPTICWDEHPRTRDKYVYRLVQKKNQGTFTRVYLI
jgi:hypothetical protein